MPKRILWVDNDRFHLRPHRARLRNAGFIVERASSVSEALSAISSSSPDLCILDAMLPVGEGNEVEYSVTETDLGRRTGLVFYKRHRRLFKEKNIKVLVFTIREDEAIQRGFREAGLPDHCFMTKREGTEPSAFLNKIRGLLSEGSDNETSR